MLPLLVSLPFLGALLVAVAQPRMRLGPAVLAVIAPLLALLILLPGLLEVQAGGVLKSHLDWMPAVGLALSFRLDGLGLLFALLILGIGVLIIFYAHYYLSDAEATPRFYAYLLLFQGSMLGLVLSENVLQLLLFWEMTSLTSFLLIGYRRLDADARQGARQALLITGGGGLALLAALLLMGDIAGSYELSDILAASELIKADPLYLPILLLFLLGAFTKSAQFPFHFWLPHAMSAPTPVSAYLHSATMVKAGIFLLGRFFPVLAGGEAWFYLVSGAGLATLLVGAYFALLQHDLKGLLAYSTISHLGLITLLFGLGTPLGEIAALFHIMNHAVFKASLFMAAGIIDHETGSRDLRKLNGLYRYMPHTAILAMVASAAMAGVPLLNGFLSKEMFFAETLHADWLGPLHPLLPAAATVAGVFSVAYSLRFIHDVFFNGEPVDLPKAPHEPPRWMKTPIEVLVVLCVLVGMFPGVMVLWLLEPAALAVLQEPLPAFSLALWHGFNLPLAMSAVALVGGLAVYAGRRVLFRLHEGEPLLCGRASVDWLLARWSRLAVALDARLLGVPLRGSVAALLLVSLALGAHGLAAAPALIGPRDLLAMDLPTLVAALLLVGSAIGVAWLRAQRFFAVLLLGVVGLMVSLLFMRFSAPDLGLTQLLVEVVTIVLVLLALYYLPEDQTEPRRPWTMRFDVALGVAVGVGMSVLTFAMLSAPFDTISTFFVDNAKVGGGGTNIVNVILVDFRALDTLGEITVLGIAAVGVYAMMHGFDLPARTHDWQGGPWSREPYPVIPSVVAHLALPISLMVSAYLFLRGHNEPGGGFIAGLVTGTALVLEYVSHGVRRAEQRIGWDQLGVVGVGLLVAVGTGVASFAYAHPFLTSTFGYLTWPVVGTFEVASALAFDLGVYLAVVGTVVLVLATLGRLGSREEQV